MYYLICIFICIFYSLFGKINTKTHSACLCTICPAHNPAWHSAHHPTVTQNSLVVFHVFTRLTHNIYSSWLIVPFSSPFSSPIILCTFHNQFWAFKHETACNQTDHPHVQVINPCSGQHSSLQSPSLTTSTIYVLDRCI